MTIKALLSWNSLSPAVNQTWCSTAVTALTALRILFTWYFLLGAILVLVIGSFLLLRFTNLPKRLVKGLSRIRKPPNEGDSQLAQEGGPSSFNLNSVKREIDQLKGRVDVLEDRLSSTQTAFGGMQLETARLREKVEPEDRPPKVEKLGPEVDRTTGRVAPPANSLSRPNGQQLSARNSDITAKYNSARTDQESRLEFREQYKPFFINVTNDLERRRDGTIPADFRKESHGSYLAVASNSEKAFVFPDFTLVVVDAVYGPGGLSEVFECANYDRRCSYPNVRVTQPAVFRLQGGDSWVVDEKGTLELGQEQSS